MVNRWSPGCNCCCDNCVEKAELAFCECMEGEYGPTKTAGDVKIVITGTPTFEEFVDCDRDVTNNCPDVTGTYIISCTDDGSESFGFTTVADRVLACRHDDSVCSGVEDIDYEHVLEINVRRPQFQSPAGTGGLSVTMSIEAEVFKDCCEFDDPSVCETGNGSRKEWYWEGPMLDDWRYEESGCPESCNNVVQRHGCYEGSKTWDSTTYDAGDIAHCRVGNYTATLEILAPT